MTFSGTASGDWNLSCVRGQIDSVTFTFNDGEIVTVDSSNLGWISDEYGVPCIKGEKISNAGPVLAKRVMAGALTSGADTYARAQQDTVITGSGVAVDIEDANKYATYNALSGGARELERHFDKRMAQIFDAIYVANGTKVMIHIEDVIEINRDSNNRKVRYENEKNDYFAD
jgi:integrating conjugative element protein (TIGR03752 family)